MYTVLMIAEAIEQMTTLHQLKESGNYKDWMQIAQNLRNRHFHYKRCREEKEDFNVEADEVF